MAEAKKKGLGRGLDALFNSIEDMKLPSNEQEPLMEMMAIDRILPGMMQPREKISTDGLADLAASIKAQGILNPISVRPHPSEPDRYEIIAGERRFRAANMAGLTEIPVIVRRLDDKTTLALALIENLQREDLNPMDEAQGIQRLVEEFSFTHEEAAQALGRSRAATTNALRLLGLTAEVQAMVRSGTLSMGHARALLTLPAAEQIMYANEIVAKGLNVRQTEALVQRHSEQKPTRAKVVIKTRDDLRLEEALADALGTTVKLSANKKGKGKIIIEFANLEQLQGIVDKIQKEE